MGGDGNLFAPSLFATSLLFSEYRSKESIDMQEPKMGGQAVTRLFIKGNEDIIRALLSQTNGGAMLEEGVGELIGAEYDGRFQIETTVEPAARVELLLQQLEGVAKMPEDLAENGLASEFAYQFNSQLFEADADIIIFSIQPDLVMSLWQHKQEGTLICPPADWQSRWSDPQKSWFEASFEQLGELDADVYKNRLTTLIQALKEKTSAHIIMFGACSFDASQEPHNLNQSKETLTMQTHRFNLVMLELSFAEGITFIDVDRELAEMGCAEHVDGRFDYSTQAYQAIRDEFVRVITDVGFFEERPLLVQMGHRSR